MNQFIKRGKSSHLQSEQRALETLNSIKGIRVPACLFLSEDGTCLSMVRYDGECTQKSQELLGIMLAKLHLHPVSGYGWPEDNFIGRLPQENKVLDDWCEFWVVRRLLPQLDQACSVSPAFGNYMDKELWLKASNKIMRHRRASLIHGDLWNGNVVFDADGLPVFIDPSIYVGVGHVDLAMTRLFGGFTSSFYESYYLHTGFPQMSDLEMHLYQLYYLLVHVNMFGGGYVRSSLQAIHRIYSATE